MKELGLLVFTKEEAHQVIDSLGLVADQGGYLTKNGSRISCSCCGRGIKATRFGGVLPGSRYYVCDTPVCLVAYVDEKLDPHPSKA